MHARGSLPYEVVPNILLIFIAYKYKIYAYRWNLGNGMSYIFDAFNCFGITLSPFSGKGEMRVEVKMILEGYLLWRIF